MLFKEDYSYINQTMIDRGFKTLDIHSLRIDRHFTEEEKQRNFDESQSWTTQQINDRATNFRKVFADKITKIVDLINENFKVYQYKDEMSYRSMWDLFFWCNNLYNTTNDRENGRDMSYVTLSFNDKMSRDERFEVLERVKLLLTDYEENNVAITIQYSATENTEYVEQIAEEVFKQIDGKTINLFGYGKGKIKRLDDKYTFWKSRAKTHYYRLEPLALCTMID